MAFEGEFTPVSPTHPPAAYIGGKRRLAAELVRRIGLVPHRTYTEPFVGMGGVFFRRTWQPPAEVINDRNGEVANLFRLLQRHYPQFIDTLRYQITGRREFERLKASDPSTLTDLERAGRFLYLQRTAFGGKVAGQTFGVSPGSGGGFNLNRLVPVLEAIHERLAGVVIENLDWPEFNHLWPWQYRHDSAQRHPDQGHEAPPMLSRLRQRRLASPLLRSSVPRVQS